MVEGPVKLAPDAGEVKHKVTVYAPEEGVLEAHELLTVLSGVGMEAGSIGKAVESCAKVVMEGAENSTITITNRMINNRLIRIYSSRFCTRVAHYPPWCISCIAGWQ